MAEGPLPLSAGTLPLSAGTRLLLTTHRMSAKELPSRIWRMSGNRGPGNSRRVGFRRRTSVVDSSADPVDAFGSDSRPRKDAR